MRSTDRDSVPPRLWRVGLFNDRLRQLALTLVLLCLSPLLLAQTLTQDEDEKLTASSAADRDAFGSSVSISGNRALAGAPFVGFINLGLAYIFEKDVNGNWEEVFELRASDSPRGKFGSAVSLSGDRALVGATEGVGAVSNSGSAYIFERNVEGEWIEVAKLTASDGAALDFFGHSVSLSGDRALVGAVQDDDLGEASGSAYVFERNGGGNWIQVDKITASNGTIADFFGWSVSLSDELALVGSLDGDGAVRNSGAAYLFEHDGAGNWIEVAKLTASANEGRVRFGQSVSIVGNRALVGAVGTNNSRGSAHLFERNDDGRWLEIAKLIASDDIPSSQLGSSVALASDRALVGAVGDPAVGINPGAAYVFERNMSNDWVEVTKLVASDGSGGDGFGISVALSAEMALIGAFRDDDAGIDSGSAYVFDVSGLGDADQDGIVDAEDNCPADANPLQEDFDQDLLGDVCDLDDDNDGVDDLADAFPLDDTRAVSCEPGFFGAFSCEPAPIGTFVADVGALVATDCPVGFFSATEGSVECDAAPIGFFVDTTGAGAATACPAGTTTEATGSASADDCVALISSPASASVAENQTAAINVQSIGEDGDNQPNYSLSGEIDDALFDIDAATGVVTFINAPDFETPLDVGGDNVYNLQVTVVYTEELIGVQDIAITVTDVAENTAPVINSPATASVPENQTTVIDVQSTDDNDSEGEGLGYSLTGGADVALFAIDESTGVITFLSAPDFENPSDAGEDNIYNIEVTVSDSEQLSAVQTIAITVTDVNENTAPQITSPAFASVPENQTAAIDVQTTDDNDAEGAGLSYWLTGGVFAVDVGLFAIDESTGVITFLSAPDFENPADDDADNVYQLQITVSDSEAAIATQNITITVTDVAENSAPVITSQAFASVPENQIAAIDVQGTDDNDSVGAGLSYAISGGADAQLFSIDAVAGVVTFNNAPDFENPLDAGGDNDYNLQVTVSDSQSLSAEQDIVITVTDEAENTAPVITSPASTTVAENQTAVLDVQVTDDNDSEGSGLNYSISGGIDSGLFTIDAGSGVISFITAPDFEAPADDGGDNVYNIQVSVSDSGELSVIQNIRIIVVDELENTAPVITSPAAVSVVENQTFVLDVQSDDDVDIEGGELIYSFFGGFDSELFSIDAITGVIRFNIAPNFEAPADSDGDNVYKIQVSVIDSGELSTTQDIAITVTDVNENTAPIITSSTAVSVPENQIAVLDVQATDDSDSEGAGLSYTFSGGVDDPLFTIDPSTGDISFVFAPDFEVPTDSGGNNVYDLQVSVIDSNGLSATQPITVTVTDVNENTLPVLTIGVPDSGRYGFRYGEINNHREVSERQFDAGNTDLLLTVTGFDIDVIDEVRVLVNGTEIGFLEKTPNNGSRVTTLVIPQSLLTNTGNTLRFEQNNPGWRWGVTDLLLSESGDTGGLPPLVIDSIDSAKYGFRYDGVNDQREVLERIFDASGTDLLLTLSGFDIDVAAEVRVLVNGSVIGFVAKTPNNGNSTTELAIAQSLLNSTGNTLRFEQRNPGWKWGVTNLLLSESDSGVGELPPLVLDSVDTTKYGFRYDGISSHREFLERQFEASGTAVLLTVSGFDIDTNDEVRVLVNGTEVGFLSRTPNNGTRTTQLVIPQGLLNGTGNTLRFEQSNPGWIWGVTDLLLSASDGGA